jgi:hypothetical protein
MQTVPLPRTQIIARSLLQQEAPAIAQPLDGTFATIAIAASFRWTWAMLTGLRRVPPVYGENRRCAVYFRPVLRILQKLQVPADSSVY